MTTTSAVHLAKAGRTCDSHGYCPPHVPGCGILCRWMMQRLTGQWLDSVSAIEEERGDCTGSVEDHRIQPRGGVPEGGARCGDQD